MTPQAALDKARETWPHARLRVARKWHHCDNAKCPGVIQSGDTYVDPGDSNPDNAGGFGNYRYCVNCAGGQPERIIARVMEG